ncbi:MAG: DUF4012 domain-containing protein, partial [Candidatus Paceibacterota bacterium]
MKKFISILVKLIRMTMFIAIPLLIIVATLAWINYRKELSLAMAIRNQGEINYLVIFQNTLELRPTGGFIGNFAEITLDNGIIKDYTIYNTNVFDYGKPGIDSPEPYKNMLGIQQMQLRDANWSPDFPTTAQQIIELYKLEGGTKNITGVIAINASVLPEILDIIGPISINSIDKELNSNNILLELQYELNFGFIEKGISRESRKEPVKDLAFEIDNKISKSSIFNLYILGETLLQQANQKQIMLWSKADDIQSKIAKLSWDGAININTQKDYLKVVDANLGALKTDYYMKRSIKKDVKVCGDKICSTIIITYNNTATESSPLNTDYKSYTRVLLPKDAFVDTVDGVEKRVTEVDYSLAYNKKVAGFEIKVPLNSSKDIR